jgi:hypothetical protein
VSVALAAWLTVASAGCRVFRHAMADERIMADGDRQRSLGIRDLRHGVRGAGSARIDG